MTTTAPDCFLVARFEGDRAAALDDHEPPVLWFADRMDELLARVAEHPHVWVPILEPSQIEHEGVPVTVLVDSGRGSWCCKTCPCPNTQSDPLHLSTLCRPCPEIRSMLAVRQGDEDFDPSWVA